MFRAEKRAQINADSQQGVDRALQVLGDTRMVGDKPYRVATQGCAALLEQPINPRLDPLLFHALSFLLDGTSRKALPEPSGF